MANKTSTDREVRTNSEQHKGFRGDKHGNLNSNGKNAVRKRRSYNKFERKAKKEHEAIIEHKYAERVIKWDQLPAWMKDNIYILSGYRAPTGSYKKCIASLLLYCADVYYSYLGFPKARNRNLERCSGNIHIFGGCSRLFATILYLPPVLMPFSWSFQGIKQMRLHWDNVTHYWVICACIFLCVLLSRDL